MKSKLSPMIVATFLLTAGCSTTSLDNHQQYIPLNELSKEINSCPTIDSFYLTRCEWPNTISINSLQDSAWQMQEVMNKYRECYVRHNGLIDVLNVSGGNYGN